MKTESWLRIINRLCEIDEWLSVHVGWLHNTGLWMPVCQWMHAELTVWSEYWERREKLEVER